jgi:hypothetical protein
MEFLLALSCILSSSTVFAATSTVVDTDKDAKLAALPRQLISVLTQARVPYVKEKDGLYTVTVNNIRCESRSNSAVDTLEPRADIRATTCRIDTDSAMSSTKGTPIGQSMTLTDRLFDANLGDCSLGGKCLAFAKSIVCKVDTKIEPFANAGRFSCVIDDGN